MGSIFGDIGALVTQYPAWSHWIIAVAILIQGEVVVLVSVFLVASHTLSWYDYIVPAISSLIFGDILLFWVGKILRNTRIGWRWYRKIKHNRRAQFYFYYVKENVNKLMIISKFLVGANVFAVLAVSWSKTGFGKFLKSQLTSVMLWFVSATAIAYFLASGFSLLVSEKIFQQVEIGAVVGMILIFFVGEHFLKKKVDKTFDIKNKIKEVEMPDENEEPGLPQ
jgi:membrane protein DedA with SNARE-associated domain